MSICFLGSTSRVGGLVSHVIPCAARLCSHAPLAVRPYKAALCLRTVGGVSTQNGFVLLQSSFVLTHHRRCAHTKRPYVLTKLLYSHAPLAMRSYKTALRPYKAALFPCAAPTVANPSQQNWKGMPASPLFSKPSEYRFDEVERLRQQGKRREAVQTLLALSEEEIDGLSNR